MGAAYQIVLVLLMGFNEGPDLIEIPRSVLEGSIPASRCSDAWTFGDCIDLESNPRLLIADCVVRVALAGSIEPSFSELIIESRASIRGEARVDSASGSETYISAIFPFVHQIFDGDRGFVRIHTSSGETFCTPEIEIDTRSQCNTGIVITNGGESGFITSPPETFIDALQLEGNGADKNFAAGCGVLASPFESNSKASFIFVLGLMMLILWRAHARLQKS